ncbi:type II toxin-antitoxin system RelE/ParE family toxin [Cereibacter azotoformans]|uniref:type II toxin-antitoxin system RelE/ParE family toxin n=1 Tax=Cereibacter azotoformans TaxID=43057 RepID=UPI0038996AB8
MITAEAEADLETIGDYIARDNPVRALSFLRELYQLCLDIADMPQAWPRGSAAGGGGASPSSASGSTRSSHGCHGWTPGGRPGAGTVRNSGAGCRRPDSAAACAASRSGRHAGGGQKRPAAHFRPAARRRTGDRTGHPSSRAIFLVQYYTNMRYLAGRKEVFHGGPTVFRGRAAHDRQHLLHHLRQALT